LLWSRAPTRKKGAEGRRGHGWDDELGMAGLREMGAGEGEQAGRQGSSHRRGEKGTSELGKEGKQGRDPRGRRKTGKIARPSAMESRRRPWRWGWGRGSWSRRPGARRARGARNARLEIRQNTDGEWIREEACAWKKKRALRNFYARIKRRQTKIFPPPARG
jgi:hypothetical protein